MKQEKTIKTHQRTTKSGKRVIVRQHTAKYDAANELKKSMKKEGAGIELSAPSALQRIGFSYGEYAEWYNWDYESDPENEIARKVEAILQKRMSKAKYRKYFDEIVANYSEDGAKKAYNAIPSKLPQGGIPVSEVRKQVGVVKKISDATLRNTLQHLHLEGTIANLLHVDKKRRGEILDELERRGYIERGGIRPTRAGIDWSNPCRDRRNE